MYVTLATFGAVILVIAFDLIDMAVAALLGVSVLFGFNILGEDDVISAVRTWSRAPSLAPASSTV